MSRWKKFRHALEHRGVAWLARAIPRLSRGRCVGLANALGALAYVADARGRAVALANLECAFGDRFTPPQRRAIARASYRNFLRTMLDLFWAQNLTPENWREWMHADGFDELRERLAREGRGTIFMCVHQGNWEWASLASGFLGFGNVVVAENFKNPLLTEIFSARRQHSGQTIIPQENSLLRMLKIVKRGGATGMLIDLNLRPSQAATVIECFGLKMCVPVLQSVLAQRANALLVPVETEPRPDGTCRVTAHPGLDIAPGASLQAIAQQCWDAFEPIVRARPESWLWPYKHFRYKPRDAAREYPFYANDSAKFEKLLRQSVGGNSKSQVPSSK
ncbi:MAG TPA: lysophospholipid acyltransferase family protein [Chthoniobacteraceae bacterium]|nr:lysophospholipid acyltransferase family protein [Chthoniobacteraceae bacterium]